MPNLKYPIAIWLDDCDNVTVSTLDGFFGSAIARDQKTAMESLKKFLTWRHKTLNDSEQPEFDEPRVASIDVKLRGQSSGFHTTYPNEFVTTVTFQYVVGIRSDKTYRCVFPKLGVDFNCSKESLIKTIAEEFVKNRFARESLNEIVLAISTTPISIDYLNVWVDRKKSDVGELAFTENLREVAIPMGVRSSSRVFETAWNRTGLVNLLTERVGGGARNVLLIGKPGVGKTTLLAEVAKKLQQKPKSKPKPNSNDSEEDVGDDRPFSLWLTNASRIISGMQYLGQWEARCEKIVAELAESQGVLCVENLLDLVLTGQDPGSSVASFFRNFILNDELRMIAEATPRELEVIRRLLPGFDSLFEIVSVPEMNEGDSLSVLDAIARVFSQNHKLEVSRTAVSLIVQLFRRFLPYDPFPGKCVVFWRKLIKTTLKSAKANSEKPRLDNEDVIRGFTNETGLPEFLIRDEILLKANDVRSYFDSRIVGQPEACEAMTRLVMRVKAAMNDPARPLGVHLFCGPTGVGKTEMAKTLSRYLFGASQVFSGAAQSRMIRLDMSEYASIGSAQRLFTKSDGTPSNLIEKMRLHPFSVVLFDEIEKAAPEVFDALMNVFDEGYLLDSIGRETNFRSSVIILTSNLGAQIADAIGFSGNDEDVHSREVRKFFRPEFFNRLDGVLNFHHLSSENIERITEIDVQSVAQREGLEKRNIRLACSPQLVRWLSKKGYDRRLGARPLQRTIETHIITPIARFLAENPEAENLVLTLDLAGESVSIEPRF